MTITRDPAGRIRVALAQIGRQRDIASIIAAAAEAAADLVIFPEMISNGYPAIASGDQTALGAFLASAEPVDGPFVSRAAALARTHGIALVVTFLEAAEGKPFNSAALIDRTGTIRLLQRKRHICFFDAPEENCAPGIRSDVATIDLAHGTVDIGILICMDREFSDAADDLAVGGAELVLVPNSCALVEDPDVGDVRTAGIRALAFDRVMAVAVANYPAPKNDGHSVVVDHAGRVLAQGDRKDNLILADIDLVAVRKAQSEDWFRRDRRAK